MEYIPYPTEDDYYGILQVSPFACKEVIKAAYKALALLHHPDQNRDDDGDATRQFQLLNEAHECLTDDLKRQFYDQDVYPGVRAQQEQAWHAVPPPFTFPDPPQAPQPWSSPRRPPPPQPDFQFPPGPRPRQPPTANTVPRPHQPQHQHHQQQSQSQSQSQGTSSRQGTPHKQRPPPPRQSSWQESFHSPPRFQQNFSQNFHPQYRPPPSPDPPEGLFQKLKTYNSDIKKLNNMRRMLADKMNEAGWAHNSFLSLQPPIFQLFSPGKHAPRDCHLHETTIRWARQRAHSEDMYERIWMLNQMLKIEEEEAALLADYSDFYYEREGTLRSCEVMRDTYLGPKTGPPPPPPTQPEAGYFSQSYPPDGWL